MPLSPFIHSFIHSFRHTNTQTGHQGQEIDTSHTSHSLHSHARGVRCIPRSQTQFRVATPRVNPGSRLNPCNHLTWLACGRWRTQSFTTHTNSPTRKGHTKIPPRTRDTRFILIHVLIHVRRSHVCPLGKTHLTVLYAWPVLGPLPRIHL